MAQYQRTGHKIKLNHSNALPRYILSLGVDDVRDKCSKDGLSIRHRFSSASLVSGRLVVDKIVGRNIQQFTTVDDLWANILGYTRNNYTTWLVGHNVLSALILAGLPYRFACGDLSIDRPRSKRIREDNDEDDPFTSALAVLESPPTIIGCRVGQTQGRLVIVDLGNWFPGELSTIAAACGFATIATHSDWTGDDYNKLQSSLDAFNVHKIFEGLIAFVREAKLGMFRYTASSQAMSAYRHARMNHTIYVHDNAPVMKTEREAYFGGRSDVFRIGKFTETMYHLDVSALFPSVMKTECFPCQLTRYQQRDGLSWGLPVIDYSSAVMDVEILTDKPLYPLRTESHVIYPVGRFATTLCGAELYRAVHSGCVTKFGSWSEYKMAPIFKLWVDDLWAMRCKFRADGNMLYEQLTKRIMNSLYGKFAQLTPSWINCKGDWSMLPFTTETRRNDYTNEWETYRAVGWQCQKLCERKERAGSFYAVAAFVTAAARIRMDNLRHIAGKNNVYYQGVDSLITNRTGFDKLLLAGQLSESEIGKLRLIGESNIGYINGISDYAVGDRIVLSSRSLHFEITSTGDIMQHRHYVLDNLFRNGPIDTIEERIEKWSRQGKYPKGNTQDSGWVAPFELGTDMSPGAPNCSPDDRAADAILSINAG
jgi:hypothetical protein